MVTPSPVGRDGHPNGVHPNLHSGHHGVGLGVDHGDRVKTLLCHIGQELPRDVIIVSFGSQGRSWLQVQRQGHASCHESKGYRQGPLFSRRYIFILLSI
jgi:hypothetical protein